MSKSDVVSHSSLAQYFPDYLAVCLSHQFTTAQLQPDQQLTICVWQARQMKYMSLMLY